MTAFNESQRGNFAWIRECVAAAVEHPLVREVVVVNDATPDIDTLRAALANIPKVRVFQNTRNHGVFGNKAISVSASSSPWVVMCDSDNTMGADYFDRLASLQPWDEAVWYSACRGTPELDYTQFVGDIHIRNLADVALRGAQWWCLANTGNWFVNRAQFLETFEGIPPYRFDLHQRDYFGAGDRSAEHWLRAYDAQDSFYINKTWWESGGILRVVDGLQYAHRMDKDAPGNYNRSPIEKEALAPAYFLELIDMGAGKSPGQYRYLQHQGSVFWFADDLRPGIVVSIDLDLSKPIRERMTA